MVPPPLSSFSTPAKRFIYDVVYTNVWYIILLCRFASVILQCRLCAVTHWILTETCSDQNVLLQSATYTARSLLFLQRLYFKRCMLLVQLPKKRELSSLIVSAFLSDMVTNFLIAEIIFREFQFIHPDQGCNILSFDLNSKCWISKLELKLSARDLNKSVFLSLSPKFLDLILASTMLLGLITC
jgi:hypothetical protein